MRQSNPIFADSLSSSVSGFVEAFHDVNFNFNVHGKDKNVGNTVTETLSLQRLEGTEQQDLEEIGKDLSSLEVITTTISRGLFSLHTKTFDALQQLIEDTLWVCKQKNDFMVAYAFLQVSALYFRKVTHTSDNPHLHRDIHHDRNRKIPVDSNSQVVTSIEYLVKEIGQHKVYKNSSLWVAVLKDRLSVIAAKEVECDVSDEKIIKTSDTSSPDTFSSPVTSSVKVERIIEEVRSLLVEMYCIRLNVDRAKDFTCGIVTACGLDHETIERIQLIMEELYKDFGGGISGNEGGMFDEKMMGKGVFVRGEVEDGEENEEIEGSNSPRRLGGGDNRISPRELRDSEWGNLGDDMNPRNSPYRYLLDGRDSPGGNSYYPGLATIELDLTVLYRISVMQAGWAGMSRNDFGVIDNAKRPPSFTVSTGSAAGLGSRRDSNQVCICITV